MTVQYATATEARAEVAAAYFPASVLDATLDKALQDNAALMDGYLAGAFTLPLASWPGSLRRCNAILAAFDLSHGRGFDSGGAGSWIRTQRDWWIKWLEQVRDGRITLTDVEDATPDTDEGTGYVSTRARRGWRRL